MKGVLVGNIVIHLLNGLSDLMAYFAGTVSSSVTGSLIMHAVLILGFVYYLAKSPPNNFNEAKNHDELAKILWNFNCLNSPLHKVDFIIAMGSHDLRIAERAAQLVLDGYAPLLVCTGGFGRLLHMNGPVLRQRCLQTLPVKWECPIIK